MIKRLIEELWRDNGLSGQPQIPEDENGRERLLRSLMNIWRPHELSEEFWVMQDEILQTQLARKGVVHVRDLPAAPHDPQLSLWQGDITRLDADAIVNAANSAMLGCFVPCHGCIDNAIHSAAGLQLRLACQELMKRQGHEEETGKAKITPGFNLPARYVLHTVGPIVNGALNERHCRQLTECYQSCLRLADEQGLSSVAFCCISTGEFGFPQREAAQLAVQTARAFVQEHGGMKVIFNVFKDEDRRLYEELLGIR